MHLNGTIIVRTLWSSTISGLGEPFTPLKCHCGFRESAMHTVRFDVREETLPKFGRWFVGSANAKSIVVYQSLPREIAHPAIKSKRFAAPFNFKRLSWIKPSFLWTMHRTNWGQLDDCILAIHVDRAGLFALLSESVSAKHEPKQFPQKRKWDKLIGTKDALTQWDPEYDLQDCRMKRLAIQIGLRGDALITYATELIVEIDDLTDFVRQQRNRVKSERFDDVLVPHERVIEIDPTLQHWLGIETGR